MVVLGCLAVPVLGFLLYLVIQLFRLIKADGDLALLWAERFGSSPESKLRGSVVWVTGASSGIGEELCYQLAKLGAPLVLSARREAELLRVKKKCLEMLWIFHCGQSAAFKALRQEISSLEEKDLLIVPLDLTDRSTHEAATDKVLKHFGRIDILVNNGGRSQRSLFEDTGLDVYQGLIDLNYMGTISITKHVLPHMIARKKGKIITISSITGLVGVPLSTGYAASKHALQGFFNSLRIELGDYPDIDVINICPGPVISKIVENACTKEFKKSVGEKTDQTHKMSTARCVRLILVSAANGVKEAWIAEQPFLIVYYLWQYAPTWGQWITQKAGQKRIQNFKCGIDADATFAFSKKTS